MARRYQATDQDHIKTDGGRSASFGDEDPTGGATEETSFTSLEHHLFGQPYFGEDEDGEVRDNTTVLAQTPSESDTVVQRHLDEPPPVQVVHVLPPGARPSDAGGGGLAAPVRGMPPPIESSNQGLIAASGVFAGVSMVAGAALVALGLVCAVLIWFFLRPPPSAPPTPIEAPVPERPVDPVPAAPAPAAPAAPADPTPGSPLREGVRFPAEFAFNDWKPLDVDTQAMFDLAGQIDAECTGPVRITGHTDARGNDLINDRVAIARAGEVRRLLQQLGVPREQMEIGSAGADRPEEDDPSREARARNRRVTVQCN